MAPTVELPYLRVANVQDGYLDLSDVATIEVEQSKVGCYLLRDGDVVLTEGGDYDKLGRGTVWRGAIPRCLHQNHVFAVRLNQDRVLPEFFALQAASPYGKQYFLSCAKQTTTLASINKSQLSQFPVLLPPLPEQRKIAAILSTWDEAIATVERLIDALQRRKRGLMQRLLTGEVRFPEFGQAVISDTEVPPEWKQMRLGDVFERVRRGIQKELDNILSITATVGFVDQREKFGRIIAGKALNNYVHLYRGEFAYNKGNSEAYPQGCIYRLKEFDEGAVPSVYYSFRAKSDEICPGFYDYYFESGALNHQLSRIINSGVRNDGLLNLSAEEFFNVLIVVPPRAEQEKIAELFKCADAEINVVKRFATELRAQRRGLMQRLLTGEVRVPVDERDQWATSNSSAIEVVKGV